MNDITVAVDAFGEVLVKDCDTHVILCNWNDHKDEWRTRHRGRAIAQVVLQSHDARGFGQPDRYERALALLRGQR